jgi:hypothetical protein
VFQSIFFTYLNRFNYGNVKKLLSFFLLLFSLVTTAQQITFAKWYDYGGYETGYCVRQTSDGGYIIAGMQSVSISTDKNLVIKVDSSGNEIWHKLFGGPEHNLLNAITETYDGGYVVTGQTTGATPTRYDVTWIKLDNVGNLIWSKKYTPPANGGYNGYGVDVLQTPDSGLVVLSNINDTDTTLGCLLIRAKKTEIHFGQSYIHLHMDLVLLIYNKQEIPDLL